MPSRRVALLIETSKAFGRGLLAGVGRHARFHQGWTMDVEERGLDDGVPAWLSAKDLDGILVRSLRTETMREVLAVGVATVCLGEENPSGVVGVVNDDAACSHMAAEHLLQRQFRSFGYLGLQGYVWSDSRRDHFADYVKKAGFRCDVLESAPGMSQRSSWYQHRRALREWTESLPKPVGIMTCYDAAARTLLDVCREMGLLVPEEVAIVGVDNDEVLCDLCDPPLTSVAPDTEAIGVCAAGLLDRLMAGEKVPRKDVVVPPRGVVTRSSSDTVAVDDPAVAAALGCIRRHACDGIDVGDVLQRVPMSRRTLERRFRDLLGHSPLEEIRRIRVGRVKELLDQTDAKLDSIARSAGYRSTAYMIAQFRRSVGMTPGSYRRTVRGN